MLERIEEWTRKLQYFGLMISGISVAIMMLLITADVFMRNVFSNPIAGTYELVEYFLMPIAIFPALAFTYTSGILPKLTELVKKTPEKMQVINNYIILAIEIVIFGLLSYYSIQFALTGIADRMAVPVGGNMLPLYPIYVLVPIGFIGVLWVVVFYAIYEKRYKKQ